MGSSIILVTSIVTLWEWTTPVTRGFMSGAARAIIYGLAALVLMTQQALVNPNFFGPEVENPTEKI